MLHLRPLFNQELLERLSTVLGNPEIRTKPLIWDVYFHCSAPADRDGRLGKFMTNLPPDHQRKAFRSLALLARAAQTERGPSDPAAGCESHEILSLNIDGTPYTGYEFVAGPKVRMPWFYTPRISQRSLVITHGFYKKSYKAPASEQAILEAVVREYVAATRGKLKSFLVLED